MFLSMYSRHTCRVAVYLLLASFAPVSSSSAQTIPAEQLQGLTWRLIGPFRGGRVTAVAGIQALWWLAAAIALVVRSG